jgi:hypothetical protein
MSCLPLLEHKKNQVYSKFLNRMFLKEAAAMNTKILLATIVIVVTFGIAAVIGPITVPTPVVAQNMTGDNMTAMGGNMTGSDMSGGNMTTG